MKLQDNLEKIMGNVDFVRLLVIYFLLIIVFATIFFLLSFTANQGIHDENGKIPLDFNGYMESVYFSFVTSTSLGYGDIHPLGLSRFFSIVEVIVSLIIFGVLISKLLTIKQEKILDELYEVSFQERITRVTSGLYNFRAEIDRILSRLNGKKLTKNETEETLQNIEANLHLLSSYLIDIDKILSRKQSQQMKKPSNFRPDLILDNVHSSMAKIEDLISTLKSKRINWKRKSVLENMEVIFEKTHNICSECIGANYVNIQETIRELKKHSAGIKKNI